MLKAIMIGNLGRDPETRYTGDGTAVTNFSMASTLKRKDKDDITTWVRFTAFGRQAEIIAQYAQKGTQMYVEAGVRNEKWEKDGQTHHSYGFPVREFQFLSKASEGNGSAPGGNQGSGGGDFGPPPSDDFDDDIPF